MKGQSFSEEFYNESYGGTGWKGNDANFYYWVVKPYLYFELGKTPVRQNFSQSIELQTMFSEKHYLGSIRDYRGGFVEYKFDYNKRNYALNASLRADYYVDDANKYKNSNVNFQLTNKFTYKIKE